jgi:hypothetical protein
LSNLITYDGREVLGAAAIIRDVTIRRQREQELKKSLAEPAPDIFGLRS